MPEARDTPFFILGTGRCGSTLLQAMLSCHARLYVVPEFSYFGRHDPAITYSDPLLDRQVESYLADCAKDIWWQDMGLDRASFEAAIRGGVRSAKDIYMWMLGHIAERRGNRKSRFGDKTQNYVVFTDRISELFPDAQFIHLYRDPRDVTASYMGVYWCTTGTTLRLAGHIKYVFQSAERLERRVGPERFCKVKYEALIENPAEELARICRFLGEDYDPAMLGYRDRRDAGYLEVEDSYKGMSREAVTSSRIGRYAARLTPRQIWTVERMLGERLTGYGYERTSSPSVPLSWKGGFWAERIYRKVLRSIRTPGSLLDERALLQRRNELVRQRNESSGKLSTPGGTGS
jgi:sulfotransferase family protein